MNNSNILLPKALLPAAQPNRLRLRIKPVGIVSRLLSLALILWLAIGQPGAVLRLMAEDVAAPSLPGDVTISTAPLPPALPAPVIDPSGVLASLPPPPPLPTGTRVVTDQADYAPGATAHIRGQEFQAGETVSLQVLHADGTPATGADHEPWSVTADLLGGFQTTWHVCEDDCVGSTLRLTATGQTSGKTAEALFTDAAAAPTYQQLKSFGKPSIGGFLQAGLMQGTDGALYGTAQQGGSSEGGTVRARFCRRTDISG